MTRREFIKTTAAAGGLTLLVDFQPVAGPSVARAVDPLYRVEVAYLQQAVEVL